jgi:hypothetical protein
VAKCVVSFVGADRIRHSVTVDAGSMFEAAGLALVAFNASDNEWMPPPGRGTTLEVEVHVPPVTHAVTVERVTLWLNASASPSEMATKNRIRHTLEAQKK